MSKDKHHTEHEPSSESSSEQVPDIAPVDAVASDTRPSNGQPPEEVLDAEVVSDPPATTGEDDSPSPSTPGDSDDAAIATPAGTLGTDESTPLEAKGPTDDRVAAEMERISGAIQPLSGIPGKLDSLLEVVEKLMRYQESETLQLRRIGQKVDDMTTSIAESRLRSCLEDLLLVHDLLEKMNESANEEGDESAAQKFSAVLRIVLSIFKKNGVEEIDTTIPFDGELHNAITRNVTDEPELDNTIDTVYRKGFAGKFGILRAADVSIRGFEAPPIAEVGAAEGDAAGYQADAAADEAGASASADNTAGNTAENTAENTANNRDAGDATTGGDATGASGSPPAT